MTPDEFDNTPETFEKLINETNSYKDNYLRAAAELQNYKRRTEREMENLRKFAHENFAKDIIENVDNLEYSLKVDVTDDVRESMNIVYRGLLDSLKRHGITPCQHDTLDANLHEVVSVVDDETLPSNTIVAVLRSGYMLNGRLLRPAMITIVK